MEFHVLLVEDDRVTLKTIEQLLCKCDYKVTCAANGREAIKVLTSCRQNGEKVDLILTDILMPEVTGFELINEVVHGETFCDVPVVVMSSQDSQESVLQAFQAGAADYLIKPIRKNELATLWQHVWRANKARGSGRGTIVNGATGHHHHPPGYGEPKGAAAGAKPAHHRHQHLKDSSGGSSGAATSMLRSTGGTILPARAATVRRSALPPGASEASGDLMPALLPAAMPRQFRQPPSIGAAAGSANAQCSSAAGPALGNGGGNSASASVPYLPSNAALPFRQFGTSVAVHFDLNPAPGAARRPILPGGGAAAAPAGRGSSAAATSNCAAATSATVIGWSHADPAEAEPLPYDPDVDMLPATAADAAEADAVTDDDGEGDGDVGASADADNTEDPPRKRPRLHFESRQQCQHHVDASTTPPEGVRPSGMGSAPAGCSWRLPSDPSEAQGGGGGGAARAVQPAVCGGGGGVSWRGAASAAAASRPATTEGSQGSRAASASAGADGGAPDSTGSLSGDTFAESPSAYTATAATTTTTTTGSGSEAEEQQQLLEQPHSNSAGGAAAREDSPASEPGAHASGFRRYGSGAHCTAGGIGPSAAATATHGNAASIRRTATSAGPEPSAAAVAAATAATSAAERHGLRRSPGPPPNVTCVAGGADAAGGNGASSSGVAPPPGQHGLPHPAAAAPAGAAAPGGAVTLPQGLLELAALGAARHQQLWTQRALLHQQQKQQMQAVARVGLVPYSAAVGQTAKQSSDAVGAGAGAAVRSGSGAATAAAAAQPSGARCSAAMTVGPVVRHEVTAPTPAAAVTGPLRRDAAPAGGGGGGGSSSSSGRSQPANGMLRHSDRSAFTAFTVFLPGSVAAAAAPVAGARPPPPPPSPASFFNHPAAVAAAVAAATAAAGGGSNCGSMFYPHHQYGPPHPHGHLPPPPGAVQILSPVMQLHMGAAQHLNHRGAAAAKAPDHGANGTLGSAAAAAAAMAVAAAHMPYGGMHHRQVAPALAFGLPPGSAAAAAGAAAAAPPPPLRIPESVLQLIAHLSGRAAAELPVPETVTAAPVVVQKTSSAARLAALAKYLEKRKHRNFHKKVRYESRKRLAEARPRVRGQFVKAATTPTPSATAATNPTAGGAAVITAAAVSRSPPLHLWEAVAAATLPLPPLAASSAAVALTAVGALNRAAAVAAASAGELAVQDVEMEEDGGEAEEGEEEDSDESAAQS